MKFQELKMSLKNKIESVYLVFGEDIYLKSSAINLISNAVNGQDKLNTNFLSTEDCDGKKLFDLCNTFSFFGKKTVILKESDGRKSADLLPKIKEYMKNTNDSTILIIQCLEDSDYFMPLKTLAMAVDCSRLDNAILTKWIVNKVKDKKQIGIQAINKLIDYCNNYLGRIDLELDKLIAYSGEEITTNDIETLVTKDLEYNIFEFTENLGKRNKEKALKIFKDLMEDKKSAPSVLNLISNHFRRLFFVSIAKTANEQTANDLGIKEFAVKKLKEQTANFTPVILKNILQKCEETDSLIKTGYLPYNSAVNILVDYIITLL